MRDTFSHQAIQNLGDMFVSWNNLFQSFRQPSAPNPLPDKAPKMLGIISQKYRVYTPKKKEIKEQIPFLGSKKLAERQKKIAKKYQVWVDKIQSAFDSKLAKALKPIDMVVDRELFTAHIKDESPYNLISIGDFNSLVAASQESQKPIFVLTEEEIGQTGYALEEMKKNQEEFKELFEKLAKRVCNLIKDDRSKDSLFKSLV